MNLIEIVEKMDDQFKKFNTRILEVDQGRILYYSKIPNDFQSDNPKLSKPKAGLLFNSIIDIIENDQRIDQEIQNRTLGLTFYSNHLLQGNEILKNEPILPKGKQPIQTWFFLFKDSEQKERYCEVFALNLQRQEQPTQSVKQFVELQQLEKLSPDVIRDQGEDMEDEENQKNEIKQKNGQVEQLRLKFKLQEANRKKNEEEFNRLKKLQQEEEQKRQNQIKEDEERKKREDEQRTLRREQEKQIKQRIQTAWEFRYYQSIEECMEAFENFDNSMKAGLKLVKFLEIFKEQAFITVKQLICDLLDQKILHQHQNNNQRLQDEQNISTQINKEETEKSSSINESFQECFFGQHQFKRNNMFIYIAAPQEINATLLLQPKSQMIQLFNLENQSIPFWNGIIHSNQKKRQLSDEFKALNYLNDICFSQRSMNKYFKLKVPLACQVEYLGFKSLVIAVPPTQLDDSSLVTGVPIGQKYFKTSPKLELEIEALGRSLAIKPHFFVWKNSENRKIQNDSKKTVIQLSVNTEIHSGNITEFEQLKAQIKFYAEQEFEQDLKRQGLFYLFHVKDLLPLIIDENYSELIEQSNKIFNENFDSLIQNYEFRRARPEFLTLYFDTGVSGQLRAQQNGVNNRKLYNPDAYDTIEESNEIINDQMILAEMSKSFIRNHITDFVNRIDQLEICPIDSYSLRESFRLFGVNMRYLGLVAQQTKIPHFKQLCLIEMMARSIKNIFLQQFTEYLQSIQENQIPLKSYDPRKNIKEPFSDQEEMLEQRRNNFKKQSVIALPKTVIQERESINEYIESQFKEQLLDLLNLLFSKSTVFYEQILLKQIYNDFNYDLNLKQNSICPGLLLSALQYNLKFEAKYQPKDIIQGTPYCSKDESAIIKFNLKSLVSGKLYNYKTSMKSSLNTPLTTPPKGFQFQQKQNIFETILEVRFDAQSYSLIEIEICKLINKFNLFKLQQNYQLAIKVLHIRLNLISGLEHQSNIIYSKVNSLIDLAEMYYQIKQYSQSLIRLVEILKLLYPGFECNSDNIMMQLTSTYLLPKIQMIRPIMLLLEISVELYVDYVLTLFDLIIFTLEFCFGSQHHFYSKVFSIMAKHFRNTKQNDEEMNKMQIICLIKTLGHQHPQTADAYLQIGEQLKFPEQQILYFEKAYYVYEAIYSENSIQIAYIGCKLAKAYTECGKITEALKISNQATKIFKVKAQDNLPYLLELCYYKNYNYYKNGQRDQARKECEEYFNTLLLYSDQNGGLEQEENHLSQQIIQTAQKTLCTFIEIFLQEMQKEHRIFLYQIFDLIIEHYARENQLEKLETNFNIKFVYVLKQIKKMGSLQAYLEWSLVQFVEKTGADTNWLTFNFKSQETLKEPCDNFENIIVCVGRKILQQIFDKIMLYQL